MKNDLLCIKMSVYNKLFCFSSLLIDKIEGWSKLTNSFNGRGVAVVCIVGFTIIRNLIHIFPSFDSL